MRHWNRLGFSPKGDAEVDDGVMLAECSTCKDTACPLGKLHLAPVVSIGKLQQQVFCLSATERSGTTATAMDRGGKYKQQSEWGRQPQNAFTIPARLHLTPLLPVRRNPPRRAYAGVQRKPRKTYILAPGKIDRKVATPTVAPRSIFVVDAHA